MNSTGIFLSIIASNNVPSSDFEKSVCYSVSSNQRYKRGCLQLNGVIMSFQLKMEWPASHYKIDIGM